LGIKGETFFGQGRRVIGEYHQKLWTCEYMPALKSTLKGDNEYNDKSMMVDALWLLKKLRQIMAGVYVKANPALTLHEQVVIFFMTRQGQNESDDN